jgi:hypothetical protein
MTDASKTLFQKYMADRIPMSTDDSGYAAIVSAWENGNSREKSRENGANH